jgi:hypothetical protein
VSVVDVTAEFAVNRRLDRRDPEQSIRPSGAAINQFLAGRSPPTTELLQDIAATTQMPIGDLLVIAGLPAQHRPEPARALARDGRVRVAWLGSNRPRSAQPSNVTCSIARTFAATTSR